MYVYHMCECGHMNDKCVCQRSASGFSSCFQPCLRQYLFVICWVADVGVTGNFPVSAWHLSSGAMGLSCLWHPVFFLMSLLRIQIQVLVHVWPVLYLLSHLPSSHLFAFLYTRSKVLHLITLCAQRWCMMQEMLSKEVAIIVRKHSEMPTFSITFFTLKSHFLSWWVASIGKCACQKPDMLSWSPEQHKHKKNELTPQIFLKSLSLLCACGWHKCTNSNNIYIYIL